MLKIFKEIYDYRQMIFSLVKKDLRGRYKGSALGFMWTFLNPLLQLVVYTLVFSVILRNGIEKYYLFLFVGLVPWIFFSASLTGGATSVLGSSNMVKKIYFPREVMPISYVVGAFVNMLLSFVVVLAVLLFSGHGINLLAILYLPLIMLIEFVLAMGIALLSSALTVYFRDLEYILNIIAMAWQFLTPVMYASTQVPAEIIPIWRLNPMMPVIEAYRDILYYKQIPQITTLTSALVLGIVVLIIGELVFTKLQRGFAEEL